MREDNREPRRTVDADGVVRTESPRSASSLVAWGAALLLLAAVGWLFVDVRTEEPAAGQVRGRRPAQDPSPAAAAAARPALPTTPAEPEELYLNQIDPPAGERTGIHLFPPPGTKPIAGGVLVPEGYELPPGYMRHYQTTDDGERVGPILVFHPDHQPVDAAGQPIAVPADRVVPPELAPPGMPIDILEPPPVRRDFDETLHKPPGGSANGLPAGPPKGPLHKPPGGSANGLPAGPPKGPLHR